MDLQQMATTPYIKIGSHRMCDIADLDEFIEQNKIHPANIMQSASEEITVNKFFAQIIIFYLL
ncbi:hypothetical protein CAXC1_110004 [Candidatus Xenohaliotis californiensis]|uniref:DNA-binding protein n=1 Tax=Candidatus Xenohaliotis californiensis TaxID=84677 RepID=A0ABM9N6U5_9RICK|nr:hypothetical protein CAXC1_110004 [Candidatus Xenohaliotis californiensis]